MWCHMNPSKIPARVVVQKFWSKRCELVSAISDCATASSLPLEFSDAPSRDQKIVVIQLINAHFISRTGTARITQNPSNIFDNFDFREAMPGGVHENALIVLDASPEGWAAFREDYFTEFMQELPEGFALPRIVFVQTNYKFATDMTHWCQSRNIAPPQHLIWSYFGHKVLARAVASPTESQSRANAPNHSVMCLNYKARPMRARTICDLLKADLPLPPLLSWRAFPEQMLQHIAPDMDATTKRLLMTDRDVGVPPKDRTEMVLGYDQSLFDQSFFSLVSETEMSNGNVVRITEKSLKPILAGHPFFIAGNPGVLEQLRSYGLQTFGSVFDESYDAIADPVSRRETLMKEVLRLARLGISELENLRKQCAEIIEHNKSFARQELLSHPEFSATRIAEELISRASKIGRSPIATPEQLSA